MPAGLTHLDLSHTDICDDTVLKVVGTMPLRQLRRLCLQVCVGGGGRNPV